MAVNLQDIAEQMDISIATVSRSLSNHPGVNPATRAKVIEVATQLGYRHLSMRPRKNLKKLVESKKTFSILALIPAIEIPAKTSMRSQILAGISEAAHAMDVSLQVHFVPPKDIDRITQSEYQPAALREGFVDGIILVSSYPKTTVQALAKQFPCVAIHNYFPNLMVDFVGPNNCDATGELVEHLYDLGHRKIGFVSHDSKHSWLQEREAGYLKSILNCGLEFSKILIEEHAESDTDLDKRAKRIANKISKGITAWICSNDPAGYDLQRRLKAIGIRIPEDISLTGFDAIPKPDDCKLLTSAKEPLDSVGAEALRRIVARIKKPLLTPSRSLFNCKIVKGETTAPVKSN